ncbi:MAG: CDGSH iron-sulfur domain-containing protein [Thermoanaerobaculia bacterium]|nr:CDGSH iron-sulfur domain-containing protein [Thermoanaerobaculia bacterium]
MAVILPPSGAYTSEFMSDIHHYRGAEIEVTWNKHRCTHTAVCLRSRPEVFDTAAKPWVKPDAASAEAVIETVLACPSGALRFTRKDGSGAETPDGTNVVVIAPRGPLYLRGDIDVVDADGNLLFSDTRLALCRCGHSERKPFCDNTHRKTGFADEAPLAARPAALEELPPGKVTVRLAPNGPLIVRGPVEVVDPVGEQTCARTDKVSLCRCGASASKPFCDGSHNGIEWKS